MRLHNSYLPHALILATVLAVAAFAVSAGAQENTSQPQSESQADTQSSGKPKHTIAPYGLIFGTVWDAQNRPVYGVPISIRRSDQKKARWHLMSDHRGEFAQRVPAGKADYVVTAEIKPPKGKKDWKKPKSTAHIENDERTDVGLHLTE